MSVCTRRPTRRPHREAEASAAAPAVVVNEAAPAAGLVAPATAVVVNEAAVFTTAGVNEVPAVPVCPPPQPPLLRPR